AAGDEGGPATLGERGLEERPGVDEAQVDLTVPVCRGIAQLARDGRARGAAVSGRSGPWIEVDAVDQRGVDHALADAHVKEQRDAETVDEVRVVSRRRSADVEER